MKNLNPQKLTCAPEPPPICTPQGCIAPPVRCVATCDAPPTGECVIVCCAAFGPEPIPTLSAGTLGLTIALIAVASMWVRSKP